MKIIISAYACSPYKGSEPGVGWGFIKELALLHELCVITEFSFKDDIERYINNYPELAGVRFEYVTRIRNRVTERLWPPAYYWTYRRWHNEAYQLAQKLHQDIRFDIAHQLTMIGFREPGYLWKLNIPFVWGPIGGMGFFPWRFLGSVGLRGFFYFLGYNLFNFLDMQCLSRPRRAAKKAGEGLIVANSENLNGASSFFGVQSSIIFPVGPASIINNTISVRKKSEPLRIVFTGLLNPGKAVGLAIRIVSQIPKEIYWEFHVVGDGSQLKHLQKLATKFGVQNNIIFYGRLSREKALNVMKDSHVMLFPSLREGTPTVIVEAFSLGVPVLCLNHSGMADMVTSDCGVLVPVTTPSKVLNDMAQALVELARDEPRRQSLARGALLRAHHFEWAGKAAAVGNIYRVKANGVCSTASDSV